MKGKNLTAKDFYLTGLSRIASGNFPGAIEAFQKALAEDGQFFMARLGWSQVLDRQGRIDEAIVQAKMAIELVPEEPLAHTSLSRLFQQKGMIAEAEEEMALSQSLQKSE